MKLPSLPAWLGGKKEKSSEEKIQLLCFEMFLLSTQIPLGGDMLVGDQYSYKRFSCPDNKHKVDVYQEVDGSSLHQATIIFQSDDVVQIFVPLKGLTITNDKDLSPEDREEVICKLRAFILDISVGINKVRNCIVNDCESRRSEAMNGIRGLFAPKNRVES